jgi:selenocysteine lyase/cysteine desulfurase
VSAPTLTDDEVAHARAATPGCAPELDQVHLNHAGASLPPQVVVDTQLEYLRSEAITGGYEVAAERADDLDAVKGSIARLLRARPHEIARFENATAAWNAAFWAVPMKDGQRVLVHDHEYGANTVAFLRAEEEYGVVVERVPSDDSGQVSVAAMADALSRGDVALVSLTHVPTNGGLVNPAAPIGALARSAGVPFLLDACQAVGQLDLDVEAIGCDFLSATGRKFLRGPRGTGFLYVRESILDRVRPSQPDHHGADLVASDRYELAPGAQRFEYWEYDHAAWLGLGAAVEHALGWGTDRIEATVAERAAQLRERLADAGFRLYDQGIQQCGIVTVGSAEPDGPTAEDLAARLTEHRIHSSLAVANSARYDFDRRDLPTLVRLSVHYTTTVDELDRTVEVLGGV